MPSAWTMECSVAFVAVAVSASTARQGMFSRSMRSSRKYADLDNHTIYNPIRDRFPGL